MKLLRNELLSRDPVLPSQSAGTQLIYQAKSQANPAAPKYQKHSYEGSMHYQQLYYNICIILLLQHVTVVCYYTILLHYITTLYYYTILYTIAFYDCTAL